MRKTVWFALVFAALPSAFAACGGRSQIELGPDPFADAGAGAAGSAGASAGVSGASGKGGTGGGTAGTAGKAGTGGIAGTGGMGGAMGGAGTGGAPVGPGGAGMGGAPVGGGGVGGAPVGGAAGKGGAAGTAGKGGKAGGGGTIDVFDGGIPLPDGGPVGECVQCLSSKCGTAINGCVNDPVCTMGVQCAVTKCAGGGMGAGGAAGGLDFMCLLGCFNGNFQAAINAVQVFTCISMTCASQCAGGLGDGGFIGGMGAGGAMMVHPGGRVPQYIDGVRIPFPEEVEGYPELQRALTPGAIPAQ